MEGGHREKGLRRVKTAGHARWRSHRAPCSYAQEAGRVPDAGNGVGWGQPGCAVGGGRNEEEEAPGAEPSATPWGGGGAAWGCAPPSDPQASGSQTQRPPGNRDWSLAARGIREAAVKGLGLQKRGDHVPREGGQEGPADAAPALGPRLRSRGRRRCAQETPGGVVLSSYKQILVFPAIRRLLPLS